MITKDFQNNTGTAESVFRSEAGKGTTWAMITCLAGVAVYLYAGREFLDANIGAFYHNLIVLTLAIVTVFTVGCVLHMIFIGDKSARELRRELRRQNEETLKFVLEVQERACALQTLAIKNAGLIRPRSLESISQVRRIVTALHQRTEDIKALLSTGDKIDLIDAHELLGQKLVVIENAVSSLIGAAPLAPIEPNEVASLVEGMIHEIEADLRRVELRKQAA